MSPPDVPTDVPTAPTSPGDLARWFFWVPLRNVMEPDRPRLLRALHRGWRARYLAARSGRPLMIDELRRCFGSRYTEQGYQRLVRRAYQVAWRVHLEELMLGKVDRSTVDQLIRIEGLEHLQAGLERGKGVIWAYPHAGAVMMMMASLSHQGFPYTQYAARGLPPEAVARDHPELLASNRWREAVRRVREANEDRLPAKFLTLAESARKLYRRLGKNELVGIAYDGRIGNRWAPLPFLGRTALLNPGPYRLAVSTQAALVPAFCHTPVDGPAICKVGAPLEPGRDWRELAHRFLAVQQAWIERWPEEYGVWLLHARLRNNIDDHPLFTDHAVGDAWRRWMPAETTSQAPASPG